MSVEIITPKEIVEIRITDGYYLTEIVLKSGLTIKLKMPDVEVCRKISKKE